MVFGRTAMATLLPFGTIQPVSLYPAAPVLCPPLRDVTQSRAIGRNLPDLEKKFSTSITGMLFYSFHYLSPAFLTCPFGGTHIFGAWVGAEAMYPILSWLSFSSAPSMLDVSPTGLEQTCDCPL